MEKKEREFYDLLANGFLMLLVELVLLVLAFILLFNQWAITGIFLLIVFALFATGFFIIEPNEAKVILFFGKYVGTIRKSGFHWANPFYLKRNLSLRARNLDVPPIKVNDKSGNPILIGMVLVWKLEDTYRCTFDIDAQTLTGSSSTAQLQRMGSYENFVKIQSDSALRSIAGHYSYDSQSEENEVTLRSAADEIICKLETELNSRLEIAGIEVVEARINYLAYAPEIASVMLRRQQAEAIISAREKIVEGAVSMVHLALNKLSEENIVKLDDERKAAMVSNLLVVLCADEQAQPVINTGTLYQ